MRKLTMFAVAAALAGSGFAEVLDRPTGIKIGQRLTLKPYVSLSVAYDSNVNASQSSGGSKGDVLWRVNPGFNLDYKAENWSLLLNA